jgi:hypothetical protein
VNRLEQLIAPGYAVLISGGLEGLFQDVYREQAGVSSADIRRAGGEGLN